MRRFIYGFLLFVSGAAFSAQVALVYENEAAVKEGKFTIASLVPEGVLVSAQLAMRFGGKLLVGPVGNSVYNASLVRLDNDLDLAVLKLGEPLANGEAQTAHQMKSRAVLTFLPPAVNATESVFASSATSALMTGLFSLRINGSPIENGIIELKTNSLKKSKFNLDVVVNSTAPIWNISIELRSDPKMSFWKVGRKTGLNDVPRPVFTYDHQALFNALKDGKIITVPIEGHFIQKDTTYIWTIRVKTKQGSVTETANVKFN